MASAAARRLGTVAGILALGPITGPLLAGALFAFRAGRPIAGLACAAALIAWWALLPALALARFAH
jgi:hypothetical protein